MQMNQYLNQLCLMATLITIGFVYQMTGEEALSNMNKHANQQQQVLVIMLLKYLGIFITKRDMKLPKEVIRFQAFMVNVVLKLRRWHPRSALRFVFDLLFYFLTM